MESFSSHRLKMRLTLTKRASFISRSTRMARKPFARASGPLVGAKMSKRETPIERTSTMNQKLAT